MIGQTVTGFPSLSLPETESNSTGLLPPAGKTMPGDPKTRNREDTLGLCTDLLSKASGEGSVR
jgi:hypothetical protein